MATAWQVSFHHRLVSRAVLLLALCLDDRDVRLQLMCLNAKYS